MGARARSSNPRRTPPPASCRSADDYRARGLLVAHGGQPMKARWKRRTTAAKRAFTTGVIETDEQRVVREDAERITAACAQRGSWGTWWPQSHQGDWVPW